MVVGKAPALRNSDRHTKRVAATDAEGGVWSTDPHVALHARRHPEHATETGNNAAEQQTVPQTTVNLID